MITQRWFRLPLCRTIGLLVLAFTYGCASPPEPTDTSSSHRFHSSEDYSAVDPALVTPALSSQLDAARSGEFLPILIRLDNRPDLDNDEIYRNAAGKAEQRAAVINYLQNFASDSQANLLQAIRWLEEDGLAQDIEPLWISNVISVEVTREAIPYLLEFQEIDYIAGSTRAPLFLTDPSWSVEHVNSPLVWQRAAGAIRGSGIVVAVIDSGVDMQHSDLGDRIWVNAAEDLDGDGKLSSQDVNGIDDDGNGWVDDVVGWDFESADNDPSPGFLASGGNGGHGTQVAGVIAGNGDAGLATGVAPGAELMVLKMNSQVSAWQAMQYALVNGADLINLSVGWPRSRFPDAATWRDAVDNASNAGVLVVAAAGNGGNAPMVHALAPGDITLPGSVPRALTVSAVGAPSASEWLDPVATFSAAGPVSWQSVKSYQDYPYPPGLMKPDLTAPGISIRSTAPGGGYVESSGSSFAAAHVSGAAALLLETSPTLQPHELMYILRETAWRFSVPNDVRGWGRLDAENAVNHREDGRSFDLAFGEMGGEQASDSIWIDNNNDGVHDDPIPGGTNRIFARVRNMGGETAGDTELRFYYAPAGTLDVDSLAPGEGGGAFRYIGSYHIPVTGPQGSSQDTFTGAVEWVAPQVDGPVGHWALAVEAVTPTPINKPEITTENNRAVRNDHEIVMAPGQTSVFAFNIYGDPEHPGAAIDLELVRGGSPAEFLFDLVLPVQGSTLVYEGLTTTSSGVVSSGSQSMSLVRDRGRVKGLQARSSEARTANLIIRAPDIDNLQLVADSREPVKVTISARNEHGSVGSVTIDVRIDPEAAKLNRVIYAQK